MYYFLIIFLFSFHSYSSTPNLDKIANSEKWIKLLHYKKKLFGYESQADGKDFFLHAEGKNNPRLELDKAIELFGATSSPGNEDAACKFPLRMKWLNVELGNPWKIDLGGCRNYIDFFSKLAAKRASIVFSSYYLNNPNTAFGHTFMRLSRYDDVHETEMLDYGINFSAEAKTSNPFTYAFMGLVGGFPGRFAAIPYYYKVREYSNAEFRDLWSYDLNLTPAQVLEMVDHIWELGRTYFDYFYFLENCSYHLLSVIEVVLPGRFLTDSYSTFAIPADTVRFLHKEGLLKKGKRRESTYSKLLRTSKSLDQESLNVAKMIATNPYETHKYIQNMPDKRAADILDVSLEAFDYYNSNKILGDDKKTKEIKFNILRSRASNPIVTDQEKERDEDFKDSPARTHSPTRLTMGQGYEDKMGKETRFEFRAAMHDLLDPLKGALREAQLEFAKLSVSFKEDKYKDSHLRLDHLSIFSIKNFPEQNFWSSPISWEVDFGGTQVKRDGCFDCPAPFVMGSMGNSFQTANKMILMSLLMNTQVEVQNYFTDKYRLGIGPKLYTRFSFTENFNLGLSAFYHWNTFRTDSFFSDQELYTELETRLHLHEKLSFFLKGSGFERERKWMPRGELVFQFFYE